MDKWLALQGHANDVFCPDQASLRPAKCKMAVRTMRNRSILFIDYNVLRYHLPGHLAKTVFCSVSFARAIADKAETRKGYDELIQEQKSR